MINSEIGAKPELRLLRPDEIPHVLKEGELGAVLEWAVTDPKTGKVIEHVVKKSESYVQQFLQMLFVQMGWISSAVPLSIRDTGNALRNIYLPTASGVFDVGYHLDVRAAATITGYGIVVGTGVIAADITDFALGVLIAHGAGAGAMQYDAVTFGAPGSDASVSQVTITRNFTANVGGITVQEVGLYCRAYDGAARYIMLIRDAGVAGLGIVVGAGNVLTVNYRLQAQV